MGKQVAVRRRPLGKRAKRKLQFRELQANADARFHAVQAYEGVGCYEVTPYSGPKEFFVGPFDHLRRTRRSGKVSERNVFRVLRDPALHAPYGGFRVYYQNREVGRLLSWPTYDDCRIVRRNSRRGDHGEEGR